MDNEYQKEVYFYNYCKTCAHQTTKEDVAPCYFCLAKPTNTNSHKPVFYKDK